MTLAYVEIWYSVPGGPGSPDYLLRHTIRFVDFDGRVNKLAKKLAKIETRHKRRMARWSKERHGLDRFWYRLLSPFRAVLERLFKEERTTYEEERYGAIKPVVADILFLSIGITWLKIRDDYSGDYETPSPSKIMDLRDSLARSSRLVIMFSGQPGRLPRAA